MTLCPKEPHTSLSSTSFNAVFTQNSPPLESPVAPKGSIPLYDDGQRHETNLEENQVKPDNFSYTRHGVSFARSVTPTSSFISDIIIQNVEPLSLRVTIIDEAERKVNYYLARKEVRLLERAVAQRKFKELDALTELIKTQAALADKRVFEADEDIGRVKVELTDVKKIATSEMKEMHDEVLFMAHGPGQMVR